MFAQLYSFFVGRLVAFVFYSRLRVLFLCVTVPSGGEGFYFANNNFDGFRLDHQNPCRRAPDCGKLTKCRTETARRQRRITVSFTFVVENNGITIIIPLFYLLI